MASLIFPDFYLLGLGFVLLIADLILKRSSKGFLFHIAWIGFLGLGILLYSLPKTGEFVYLSNYRITGFSLMFKLVFVIAALSTIWMSRSYFVPGGNVRGTLKHEGEFYVLLTFCTFGMFVVVSCSDLVTLFVGLELATIPLYVLTAFLKEDKLSTEASTKYVLMGTASTGVLLFGFSFIYGAAGSLHFDGILAQLTVQGGSPLFLIGTIFVVAAIGFKLAMVPFHMWAPDVYEGAPTPVTAYLSVASKGTALGFIIVLFYGPLAPIRATFIPVFIFTASLSMVVGNLGALKQTNLRRFLAYSSIAQAGYILVGFVGDGHLALPAVTYYLLIFAVTNYCTFFIISVIGQKRPETFESLRGLSKQSPGLAALLMLCMFSLAGIPPVAGFTGKFMLFASAAEGGHYGLVVFAALNSTVSLYYYLLVLKAAYITPPEGDLEPLEITFIQRWAMLILGAAVVLLGVLPTVSSKISEISFY